MLEKNSGNSQAAAKAFRRVTEIDANDPDTWYFLGASYAQTKQYSEAIDAFQHALKLNPQHASAEFGLSRAHQQSADLTHAREHLTRFQYITQNKLGSPISLAYGEQGKYSLAEESSAAPSKVPSAIQVRFVEATGQAGLLTKPSATKDPASYLGPGACFLDYDNDGRIDVFLPDNGKEDGLSLYHNVGNGKFEEVTKKAGLDPKLHGVGCTAGDYDNDGFADLVVSLNGRVLLLHNEKNGTFTDVTATAGIEAEGMNVGVTFVDYDHDGDLDLQVTQTSINPCLDPRGVSRSCGNIQLPNFNQMWRNNGNGTFTDQTEETIGKSNAPEVASIGTDYNNDRAVDLVVTGSFKGGPIIFENPREGRFPYQVPFRATLPISAGVAVLDFDHDSWMDLAFTHWEQEKEDPGLTLWRNNRKQGFDRVLLPTTTWARGFGVAAIDYDNDGWVDLVAVGETADGRGEVRLFRQSRA